MQDDEKEKSRTSYTRTYSNLAKASSIDDDKPKAYSRAYTSSNIAKVSDVKKEPSPPKRTSSRLTAKDLSTETKSRLGSAYLSAPKKEGPPITFNTRYKVSSSTSTRGTRSPSPSVASENSSKNALGRIARSRDPSPFTDSTSDKTSVNRTYANVREKLEKSYSSSLSTARERSRERSTTTISSSIPRSRNASPVDNRFLSLSSYRDKSRERSTSITLNSSNYRLSSREASPIALSYMSNNESLAANAARATRISFINRHSPQKETIENVAKSSTVFNHKKHESETSSSDEETTDESSEEEEEEEEENLKKPEPKIMIQVSTITRGTSPSTPGTSTTSRSSRRIEVAKTVEKVRERPLISPIMNDKATQSDRMDDTTRYSRYGYTVRSGYSPYSPSPNSYSSRITSGLTTSSRFAREQSEVSNADTEKSESSQKSDKFNFTLPKSKEGSPVKSDISRASSIKSPTQSRICISKDRNRSSPPSPPKSKSPEILNPMSSPNKAESLKIGSPKLTNKDFRKSALNTGPSDRQNRSKSTSSDNSSPTVEKTRAVFQQIMANNETQILSKQSSLERSSSAESESSTESIEVESQLLLSNHEMTKEEKIVVKVEEAKSFLLKTLGNTSLNKQLEDDEHDTSASTNYPTQSNDEIDLVDSQNLENERVWYANDSNANEMTTVSDIETTLQPDQLNTDHIVNSISEMSLDPSTRDKNSTKYLWNDTKLSLNRIVRVESGEKAWWCQSPENKAASDNLEAIAQNNESIANNIRWEQETQADVSELQKDEEIHEIEKNFHNTLALFDTKALGDRASPDGLEFNIDRKSPYENHINNAKIQNNDFNARPKMFISRHTNIDDLLGNILHVQYI